MKKIFLAIAIIICSTLVCTGQDSLIPIKPYISFGDSLEKQYVNDVQSQIARDIEQNKKTLEEIALDRLVESLRYFDYRHEHPATIQDLSWRDNHFVVGDYGFRYEDFWDVYWYRGNLTISQSSYMKEYTCGVISLKEANKLIEYLNKNKNSNKEIAFSVYKQYLGGNDYEVWVKVTFKEQKKEFLNGQNERMKTIK